MSVSKSRTGQTDQGVRDFEPVSGNDVRLALDIGLQHITGGRARPVGERRHVERHGPACDRG